MTRSQSVSALADGTTGWGPRLLRRPHSLCAKVYDWFGLDWLAANADALIKTPAKILLIVAARRRRCGCWPTGASAGSPTAPPPARCRPSCAARRARRAAATGRAEHATERRTQRAEAIGSVLRSFASLVILGIAVVLVLGELGVNLAPILASAGVVGVALGFGAQNLVKDFIAGIGIILEDQYGVGDVVDLGEAVGTVEAVGLRITRLRDIKGVVWYVRNGEILRVGNKSQGFAQVVIDMPVAHDTDLERCRAVMQEVADEMYADEEWAGVLLAPPESLGVEQITSEGVFLRLTVRVHQRRPVAGRPRTAAAAQGAVRRRGHPHAAAAAGPRRRRRGGVPLSTDAAEDEPPGRSPQRPATFREVFAVREFRPLFGTFLLSTAGDELARVALTVLVYQRTDSPLLAALTFAIGHLPWLLGGPLLSALADRLPRHRVLISADVVAGRAAGGAWPCRARRCRSCSACSSWCRCARPRSSRRARRSWPTSWTATGTSSRSSLTNLTLQLAQVGRLPGRGRRLVAVLRPLGGAADRRGHLRRLRRLAVARPAAAAGPGRRRRARAPRIAVAGHRRGRCA